MPIDYHIDTSRRLIVTTAKGILTQYEMLDQQRRVRDDPEFDPSYWQLHDLRNADLSEVQPECVEILAEVAIPKRSNRSAFVVGSAKADELAQMFEDLRRGTGQRIRIFRDLDDARTWLELDLPESSQPSSTRSSQELRPFPRTQVRVGVLVRSGIHEWIGKLVDISLTGALLECSQVSASRGTIVKIRLVPPWSDPGAPVELKGRVLRFTSRGVAIEFVSITEELRQLVNSLS